MGFRFEKQDDFYRVLYDGGEIVRGDAGYSFGVLRNLVVHADNEPLISLHQLVPTEFGHIDEPPDIQCGKDKAVITLEGVGGDGTLRQKTVATVRLDATRNAFKWEFEHETEFLEDYEITKFFPRTDVDPEFCDTGVWCFEITDPSPVKAFAPKDGLVSVDRPDILYPRPWFRKGGWEKNWRYFAFTRSDGETVRIPMNHLTNHDKDFWRQAPDGSLYLLGGNGANIRYRFLDETGAAIFHHYCMWGYDLHFFEIIAKGSGKSDNPRPIVEKRRKLRHHYVLEVLSDEESEKITVSTIEHPWRERDMRRLENTPRHSVGTNFFTRRLGRQNDGGFFEPATTCVYLPHHPGRREPGVIMIETDQESFDGAPLYNAWTITLGSDNWHAPIESNAIYEISVWVKLESNIDSRAKARIAAKYIRQFNQGEADFRTETSEIYHSDDITGKTGWTRLKLRVHTPEGYISRLLVAMELVGSGTCYFDEFDSVLVE